jgi:hypothetical protein
LTKTLRLASGQPSQIISLGRLPFGSW